MFGIFDGQNSLQKLHLYESEITHHFLHNELFKLPSEVQNYEKKVNLIRGIQKYDYTQVSSIDFSNNCEDTEFL